MGDPVSLLLGQRDYKVIWLDISTVNIKSRVNEHDQLSANERKCPAKRVSSSCSSQTVNSKVVYLEAVSLCTVADMKQGTLRMQ